jgi:hypothetical protein
VLGLSGPCESFIVCDKLIALVFVDCIAFRNSLAGIIGISDKATSPSLFPASRKLGMADEKYITVGRGSFAHAQGGAGCSHYVGESSC